MEDNLKKGPFLTLASKENIQETLGSDGALHNHRASTGSNQKHEFQNNPENDVTCRDFLENEDMSGSEIQHMFSHQRNNRSLINSPDSLEN